MKGFVATPPHIVDLMVGKLFSLRIPDPDSRVLDPGCGTGAFIDGILRWCDSRDLDPPRIVGVESNPEHAKTARVAYAKRPNIEIVQRDFLDDGPDNFDFIVGNPPYVSLTRLAGHERARYRDRYLGASNRFDLYLLFFEEALRRLAVGGRLVFITPEKYLYVESAAAIRRLIAQRHVTELHFLPEDSFGTLVTYPLVTTIQEAHRDYTTVRLRDGSTRRVMLSGSGKSWQAGFTEEKRAVAGRSLADLCQRISCGVATGADQDYLVSTAALPRQLKRYAVPTIAGRQLMAGRAVKTTDCLLVPYSRHGKLIEEAKLGPLGTYLRAPARKNRLLARTCVRRKPWYAYHETPFLEQILRPKILCKDITNAPHFFVDKNGEILPRHSVYYLVPKDSRLIGPLIEYLNSDVARRWLVANCQRAANGFIRLQSHVLKRMPIPPDLFVAPTPGAQISVTEAISA